MFTSNFGQAKAILAAGLEPVAISRGIPRWFKGRRMLELAPTWPMLRMSANDYSLNFEEILARLDPKQVCAQLGEKAVLLCWEKPNVERCHRRRVAEWFEQALGIIVPEFGFPREETPAYLEMPTRLI